MHKQLIRIGAVMAFLAIAFGAFGAHRLKDLVSAESVAVFDTGARYMIYHSIAIIIAGILYQYFSNRSVVYAGYSFVAGIVLFSGSLYLMTFFKAQGVVGISGIGIITPIGGLLFLLGWLLLLIGTFKKSANYSTRHS